MKKLLFLFVTVQVCVPFLCQCRDIPVYRLQVGAYSAKENADKKAEQVRQWSKDAVVSVVETDGKVPFKVRCGYFGTYQEAKDAEKAFEGEHGKATVVSDTMPFDKAENMNLGVPATLYETALLVPNRVAGISESEAVSNGSRLVGQAGLEKD